MTSWTTLLLCVVLCGATGCHGDDKPAEDKPAETESEGKAKTGLRHPDNDAFIVQAASAALECTWHNSEPNVDCQALKDWRLSKLLKEGRGDATLMNMLDDEDIRVRRLGYDRLDSRSAKWRADANMAKRGLKTALGEKEESLARHAGRIIGVIDVKETGLGDDVKAALAKSDSSRMRQGIAGSVLVHNKDAGFYDLLRDIARNDKDKGVRLAAVAAFLTAGHDRHDDTCKLWLRLSKDEDAHLAGTAAGNCARWSNRGGCTEQWDELLSTIEARAKAGTADSVSMTSSLHWLQKQKKVTAAQKAKTEVVAKAVIANESNHKSVRADARRILEGKK
jgi:hypothetical protein